MLNIGLIWFEVAKATRALKSRKSGGLDKSARYLQGVMGTFVLIFVALLVGLGGFAAVAFCTLPAMFVLFGYPRASPAAARARARARATARV